MHKNITLFCLFALLCACGPLPDTSQSGLFGRYPEDYTDGKGSSLWMPENMNARQGMYAYVVQKYIDYCVNGDYNGGKFESKEVYKELPDGGRVYAYYYNQEESAGIDDPVFNTKSIKFKVKYYTIMNFKVNNNGIITECKYMRIQKKV